MANGPACRRRLNLAARRGGRPARRFPLADFASKMADAIAATEAAS